VAFAAVVEDLSLHATEWDLSATPLTTDFIKK
jgi:hypothetical protein